MLDYLAQQKKAYAGSVGGDLGINARFVRGADAAYQEYVDQLVRYANYGDQINREQWASGPGRPWPNWEGRYEGPRAAAEYPPIRWTTLGF
jgi:hypothetical protein